jgi:hypothetical protein
VERRPFEAFCDGASRGAASATNDNCLRGCDKEIRARRQIKERFRTMMINFLGGMMSGAGAIVSGAGGMFSFMVEIMRSMLQFMFGWLF